jgi:gliding motility-associated-like protein
MFFKTQIISFIVMALNLLMVLPALGQSGNAKFCMNAEPMCSGQFYYPNTSGANFAEIGPDYGCLISQLNPSWFYLQIAENGNIQLMIEQSTTIGGVPNLDTDFIIYGPFNDPVLPCTNDLTSANIVDCSFARDFVEFVDINNALAGSYYLLMIQNYSLSSGFVTVTQTAGAATTNCNLLKDPIVINEIACKDAIITLDATTANAANYIWYEADGAGVFKVINGVNAASYNVIASHMYKAEAFTVNNVFLERYEFNTTFYETPNIPSTIQTYTVCDTFEDNDAIGQFDFNTKNEEVLNGLNPADFSVTYYDNLTDANAGDNTLPLVYTNSLPNEIIYVRVENNVPVSLQCFDVGLFSIQVDVLPEFELDATYILCVNTNGTEQIPTPPVINTGLNAADYSFVWRLNDAVLPLETDSTLVPIQEGAYAVKATSLTTKCSNTAFTTVNLSAPPEISAQVISYAFIEANDVQVTATGMGLQEHEYKIDNGLWQENSVFKNVSIGEHVFTVKNTIGCGETSITMMVMDYPLYFTPNGDGVHDTWNIAGIQNQVQAKIYIYDRYGKMLKQLIPNGFGWDGTYKGSDMPSNDYWFIVEYMEPRDGKLTQFNAHFALKR